MPWRSHYFLPEILWVLLAWCGGVIGHTLRELNKERKPRFWRVMAEGAGSAFGGVILMLLCSAFDLSRQWTGVIVGVFGWLGASATFSILEKIARKKIGAEDDEDSKRS